MKQHRTALGFMSFILPVNQQTGKQQLLKVNITFFVQPGENRSISERRWFAANCRRTVWVIYPCKINIPILTICANSRFHGCQQHQIWGSVVGQGSGGRILRNLGLHLFFFSGPHLWQWPLSTESTGRKGQWKNIFQAHLK